MSLRNKHISKHLSAYVHGELDKMRNKEARAHLDQCQRCHDELLVIREGIRLASQLQSAQAPEAIWQDIENRLAESSRSRQRREPSSWWRRMPALSLNLSRVAAIALLLIFAAVVSMYFLRPGEKSKFVWDMGPFLDMAETSGDSTLTNIAAIRPEEFLDVSQQAACEALGFAASTRIFPLNGFELAQQRIRDFGKSKVVQFVFRRQGRTYTVFLAPPTVAFTIGERKALGAQFGALRAGKVERGAALSVFWGAAKVHCASISPIDSNENLSSLIQSLNDALLTQSIK